MVRRQRALVTVVLTLVVVVVAPACQPVTLPLGTRAVGDHVEVFVVSCSGAAVDVELFETDVPVPTTTRYVPRTTGAAGSSIRPAPPGSSWTRGSSVWTGTVPSGQLSIVVPVALDPTRTYTLTATGGDEDPDFEDFTFVPAELSTDGVARYGPGNRVLAPEEFAESADASCDAAAGGLVRWILYAGIVVVFLTLAGFGLTVGLLIRAVTQRRRPPPSPTA